MWFFRKRKDGQQQGNRNPDDTPWKDRYFQLLMALADMYPYGMARLLEELGEERDLRWEWKDWVQTIITHQNDIFRNIGRLRILDKQVYVQKPQMAHDLPVPSLVLENVLRVRSMVQDWERTEHQGLPFFALADYTPARIRTAAADVWDIRNLIWQFKCDTGRTTPHQHADAMQTVLERLEAFLKNTFGPELSGLTLVCIPASSTIANDVRYAEFAARLCHITGMANGHGHLRIIGKKIPKHIGRGSGVQVELDRDWFRYRKVLFFDDVITTGSGYEFQAGLMKEARAFVIGAVFIGHTVNNFNESP